ncbi:MAG: branched-chain amino acid ABC transporter permease [Nitrososphaerota archaeon]|nr:branched-chain amino acid ABC transporter permease [Candidatus Calditenuis fumarioli]
MIPEGGFVLATSFLFYLMIYAILALSTNLEYGYTGIPNLGKVLFYFVGGIVTAVLVTRTYDAVLGIEDPLSAVSAARRVELAASDPALALGLFAAALVASGLVAGLLGYLASYPALALKGPTLSIALLIFGEAARVFVRTYEPLVGGVFGISGIANPFVFLRDPMATTAAYLVTVALITLLVLILVERLSNSPFGRVMKAVRDDELAAYSLGKDVAAVRGRVLFIGSGLAGIAGSLYTFYSQAIFPDDFIPSLTFFVLTMVIVGGVANNLGVVVGALLMSVIERLSQASTLALFGIHVPFDISYVRYAVTGALIVLFLLYRPRGLIEERPVKTPLYDVLSEDRKASRTASERVEGKG